MNTKQLAKKRILSFNLKSFLLLVEGILFMQLIIFLVLAIRFEFLYKIIQWLGLVVLWFGIFSMVTIMFTLLFKAPSDNKLHGFKGDGSIDNPVKIEPIEEIVNPFELKRTKQYVVIRNCSFNMVFLTKCRNIIIDSCKINILDLTSCSAIEIRNTSIKNDLILSICKIIKIEGCSIAKFIIRISHSNIVKNCIIQIIENESSRGNTFVKNVIPERELLKLNAYSLEKEMSFFLILLLIILSLSSVMFFISLLIFNEVISILISTIVLSIICSSILCIVLLPMLITSIRENKEKKILKKYPKNKIT
ncbi:MAG: hypothetical protein ACFFG0_32060 [Candidatus Thorarchaeota archaeon]